MKSLKHFFSKSSQPKQARKPALRPALPLFETLEGRQLMSATTISAVSFLQPKNEITRVNGTTVFKTVYQPETAVFSIAANGSVSEATPGISVSLGGKFSQISAGLDVNGKPEVYGIASDGSVWVNDGAGWSSLGGTVTQISASIDSTVFAIGLGSSAYVNHGSGWSSFGGWVTQISAGVDNLGNPELYAIGVGNSVYVNEGFGWSSLGGQVSQISAAANDTVYAIGVGNAVYVDRHNLIGGTGWSSLGGVVSQISAGIDAAGNTDVFAIGSPSTHAFVNDGNGWVDLGSSAVEIAAPAIGVAVPNNSVAIVGLNGQTYVNGASGFYSVPTTLDAIQTEYQSLGGLGGSLGQPVGGETYTGLDGGVTFQNYQNGTIYYTNSTGAHDLQGPILAKFNQLGGIAKLGVPTTDQTSIASLGALNNFSSGGAIYYQNGAAQAYGVSGPTYRAWLSYGGVLGATRNNAGQSVGPAQGFPTSDTLGYPKGQIGYFQNVKILSTSAGITSVPLTSSITYNSNYLSTSDPVGGKAQLTVNQDGTFSLAYQFNNSSGVYVPFVGFVPAHIPYKYTVSITLVSPTGNVFVFNHGYVITGNDDGVITGYNPAIAANWKDLQGCSIFARADASFSLAALLGEAGNDIGISNSISQSVVQNFGNVYENNGATPVDVGAGGTGVDLG